MHYVRFSQFFSYFFYIILKTSWKVENKHCLSQASKKTSKKWKKKSETEIVKNHTFCDNWGWPQNWKKILSVKTEKKYYSEDIYYLVWKILHPTLISNSSSTIHHSSLTGTEALGVMLFFKPKLTSSTKIFGTRSWSSSSASNPERLPLTHTTFLGQSHVCKSWLKVWK